MKTFNLLKYAPENRLSRRVATGKWLLKLQNNHKTKKKIKRVKLHKLQP